MEYKEILDYCINSLKLKGVHKSKCTLNLEERRELYFKNDKMKMFRTTYNANLQLTSIIDNKLGMITLNKLDKEAIDKAIDRVITTSKSSKSDPANDISELQPSADLVSGVMTPDNDKMYLRLSEFLTFVKTAYPFILFEEGGISYIKSNYYFENSNGVYFTHNHAYYLFLVVFTSKKDNKISSINYTYKFMNDLEGKLIDTVNLKALLKQSMDEIDAKSFDHKFEGEVIIAPDCMGDMLEPFMNHLRDNYLVTGVSLLKDKLNTKIASDKLTILSNPISNTFATNNFINEDGFKNKNAVIVEKGILKTFLLTLYGSKKTNQTRAITDGSNISVVEGNTSISEMIKNTKRGILLGRFAGGYPNDNGDFSGSAKNSYYIEDGEIKFPVKEIMISGNVLKMLNDIIEISEESIDYGFCKYPWMKVKGITVTGT